MPNYNTNSLINLDHLLSLRTVTLIQIRLN